MILKELNINEIIEEYNNGMNLHEIAKKYHTRTSNISTILKENNVTVSKKHKTTATNKRNEELKSKLNIDELINDYKSGLNTHELASKYHVRHQKISELLRENGVKVGKKIEFTEDLINSIIADYKSGMGTHHIGSKYHTSHINISKILNENGIDTARNKKVVEEKPKPIIVKKTIKEKILKPKKEYDINEIIDDYTNKLMAIHKIAEKHKIGKLKVKQILSDNNIELNNKRYVKEKNYIIKDASVKKYVPKENTHFIAISKIDGTEFNDYENNGGLLTTHIRNKLNIEIPSLYERKEYYMLTGNYWYEQWFNIVELENKPTKKCPYCDWETIDVDNKCGALSIHLWKKHGIDRAKYLKEHPEDKEYFLLANKTLNLQMEEDESKFVTCKICGKKLKRIDDIHLLSHGITKLEYIKKYDRDLISKDLHDRMSKIATEANKNMLYFPRTSKEEQEIVDFISQYYECKKDRTILEGKELDIFIPSKNIAIEYNGNKWHTEWFGKKTMYYHLNKTRLCNMKGIKLLQIFEDEYINHKDIVLNKIKHILNINESLPKIMGRKCIICKIDNKTAKEFLSDYHIQGFAKSTIYLGAIFEDKLIGVMTFKQETKGSDKWELTRFASDYHYVCQGVGGKLFKYFINHYNPSEVKSFADRRWTLDEYENLYTKLGFELVNILKPDYRYYNEKVDKYNRFHKFGFRKQILNKDYGLPLTMSEVEMVKELGYDRVWDCGLFKYVWCKK